MNKRDWSLVLFTTLSQMSIGVICCATWVVCLTSDSRLLVEAGSGIIILVFLSLALVAVATFISFLHLGSPANAPKALNNLSGSWLSREILAIGVYTVSLLMILLMRWYSGSFEYIQPMLLLSSFCGLALLWMMIRIYVQPTIPAWNSWFTPLSFISTAVSLGLLTFLVFHFAGWVNFSEEILVAFIFAIVAVLFIEIISSFFQQSRLTKMETGINKSVFDQGTFYSIYRVRMGVLIFAFLEVTVVFFKADLLAGNIGFFCLGLFSVLTVGQELAGRVLFYASYFRLGV